MHELAHRAPCLSRVLTAATFPPKVGIRHTPKTKIEVPPKKKSKNSVREAKGVFECNVYPSHLPGSAKGASPTLPAQLPGACLRGLGAGSQATPGLALRPISVRATWKLAAEYGHLVSLSEGLQILFLLKGLGPTTIFILLLSF